MAARIWSPSQHWEQYLSCLVMHVLAPFTPLFLEFVLTGQVDQKSWALFVAMYAMAIGITSSSKLMFGISLLVGVVFSAIFGAISKDTIAAASALPVEKMSMWVLVAIVVIHAAERYNRHVVDRAPFWEFDKSDDQAPPTPATVLPDQPGIK